MRFRMAALCAIGVVAASCSTLSDNKVGTIVDAVRQQALGYIQGGDQNRENANPMQAEANYLLALSRYESVDALDGVAAAWVSLGNLYLSIGRFDDATSAFTSSRQAALLGEATQFEAKAIEGLVQVQLALDKPAAALELINLALTKVTKASDFEVLLFTDKVRCLRDLDRLDEALALASTAIAAAVKGKFKREEALALYVRASVYRRTGKLAEAEKDLLVALDLDHDMESSDGIAKDLFAIAKVQSESGNRASARDFAFRSFRTALALNNAGLVEQSLQLLIDTSTLLNDTDAVDHWTQTLAKLKQSQLDAASVDNTKENK